MRYGTRNIGLLIASTVTLAGLGLGPDLAAADNTAGHALAERFALDGAKPAPPSSPAKRKSETPARRPASETHASRAMPTLPAPDREEQEMLARARAEAEQRRLDQLDADRSAEEARDEDIRRQAMEADRLRAEARQAEAELARRAEQEKQALELAQQKKAAEEAERVAEQQRLAEATARLEQEKAEQARLAALAAERAEEGRRITEKLRQAEAARLARNQQRASEPAAAPIQTATHTTAPPMPPVTTEPSGRFTVLLVMEPGNRGIRRRNKTADPVLCGESGCWISSGPQAAAHLMHPGRALGFSRTWGNRAGACSGSLGCIFRGIELGTRAGWLQPVDMRVVRHDRREPKRIDAASACRIATGRLQCSHSYHGSDYVMWVVPESIADAAGPTLLQRALAEGLPEPEHAALPSRRAQ